MTTWLRETITIGELIEIFFIYVPAAILWILLAKFTLDETRKKP